eukprot:1147065-Pelagomonas_calceolata.AAC.1
MKWLLGPGFASEMRSKRSADLQRGRLAALCRVATACQHTGLLVSVCVRVLPHRGSFEGCTSRMQLTELLACVLKGLIGWVSVPHRRGFRSCMLSVQHAEALGLHDTPGLEFMAFTFWSDKVSPKSSRCAPQPESLADRLLLKYSQPASQGEQPVNKTSFYKKVVHSTHWRTLGTSATKSPANKLASVSHSPRTIPSASPCPSFEGGPCT